VDVGAVYAGAVCIFGLDGFGGMVFLGKLFNSNFVYFNRNEVNND
jgi:hypothetical protein